MTNRFYHFIVYLEESNDEIPNLILSICSRVMAVFHELILELVVYLVKAHLTLNTTQSILKKAH